MPKGSTRSELKAAFASAKGLQVLYRSIYDSVRPSVVKVVAITKLSMNRGGDPFASNPFFGEFYGRPRSSGKKAVRSAGTGFIIDRQGIIVTNSHVVHGAKQVQIELSTGKRVKGIVRGVDSLTDVAVIKIPSLPQLKSIPIGDSNKVQVGDIALAVGNPYELDGTFTTGIISGVRRANLDASGMKFLQTDASINQGNSGGPLINLRGEVIGINRMIFSPSGGSIGLGFAIPINAVRPIIATIIRKGHYDRPFLGVQIGPLPPQLVSKIGRSGVYVAGVFQKSGAYEAGLKPNDIILGIDGRNLKSPEELSNYIKTRKVGDTVSLEVYRSGVIKLYKAKIKQLNIQG